MTRMFFFLLTLAFPLHAVNAAPQKTPETSLDKNGTTTAKKEGHSLQTTENPMVAEHGSFEAERAGFEPAVEFPPHSISSAAPSAARSPLLMPNYRHEQDLRPSAAGPSLAKPWLRWQVWVQPTFINLSSIEGFGNKPPLFVP